MVIGGTMVGRRKARKLAEAGIYRGRVSHPAVDRWARWVAYMALGVSALSVGFVLTVLGWFVWSGGA